MDISGFARMEWIGLTEKYKDNLPLHEVLAANFNPTSPQYKQKVIGQLLYGDPKEGFVCWNVDHYLENCTHYIDINKWDIEP